MACNDHWCEHYGSEKCDRCNKSESEEDKPDLRVILKRRADTQMEVAKTPDKIRGQER